LRCAREDLRGESHRPLELVVAFERIGDLAQPPPGAQAEQSGHKAGVGKNRHRQVAAVDQAFDHPGPQAGAQAADAVGQVERRRIAVKPGKPGQHVAKRRKIVGAEEPAAAATMRSNHGDAEFERTEQIARIRQFRTHLVDRMLPAGVRDQRQALRRELFPEPAVAGQAAVNVVAVRQQLHCDRAGRDAARQLLQRIGPRGVDRNDGQHPGILLGQPQHDVVGHVKGSPPFPEDSVLAIDRILREHRHSVQRGPREVFPQSLPVDPVEVALEVGPAQAHRAHQPRCGRTWPAAQAKPAAAARGAVADEMNVGVNPH